MCPELLAPLNGCLWLPVYLELLALYLWLILYPELLARLNGYSWRMLCPELLAPLNGHLWMPLYLELLAPLNRCYFGGHLICRAVGSVAFGRFGRAWQLSFSLILSVR